MEGRNERSRIKVDSRGSKWTVRVKVDGLGETERPKVMKVKGHVTGRSKRLKADEM